MALVPTEVLQTGYVLPSAVTQSGSNNWSNISNLLTRDGLATGTDSGSGYSWSTLTFTYDLRAPLDYVANEYSSVFPGSNVSLQVFEFRYELRSTVGLLDSPESIVSVNYTDLTGSSRLFSDIVNVNGQSGSFNFEGFIVFFDPVSNLESSKNSFRCDFTNSITVDLSIFDGSGSGNITIEVRNFELTGQGFRRGFPLSATGCGIN